MVYDNELTEAFVETIKRIFTYSPKSTIYVALEKRYVFTVADCDIIAPCYEYFLECMENIKLIEMSEVTLDFPQYFEYERVKELVLWKITLCNQN